MAGEPRLLPVRHDGFRSRSPVGGPGAYGSWQARTYWRGATCAEVDCEQWRLGWQTQIDTGTPLGREQADYIRHHSGRQFVERADGLGLVTFTFGPGQACFRSADHYVQAEREGVYLWRPGDHRAVGTMHDIRVYDRADQWVDDFATQLDTIHTARSRAGTAE